MNKQNLFESTITGTLILLICAISLSAQDAPSPSPPPPPAGRLGDMFIFNRLEEASAIKPIKGAPYSAQAVTEINQTLSDGNQIHHKTTANVYRDSDGRTRREQQMGGFGPWSVPENKTQQIIRINDPMAGVSYVLNPDEHTAQEMPAPGRPGKRFRARNSRPDASPRRGQGARRFTMAEPPPPGGDQGMRTYYTENRPEEGDVTTESLGSQVIEGVQADGTRRTVTIPAGRIGNDKAIQIVTERWYSNQLQAVVMSKRTDPRVGETIYRLTNISQAEPAAMLFQVPAGYTVKEDRPFRRQSSEPRPNAEQ